MKAKDLALSMYHSGVPWPRVIEFLQAHEKQPHVWPAFCLAFQQELLECENERTHISAKAVWERMRREAVKLPSQTWALDNNLHSLYARAFVAKYPMYRNVFEFRNLVKEVA